MISARLLPQNGNTKWSVLIEGDWRDLKKSDQKETPAWVKFKSLLEKLNNTQLTKPGDNYGKLFCIKAIQLQTSLVEGKQSSFELKSAIAKTRTAIRD